MTSHPSPPKRRRHKSIIAFVVVLVSLCSWWYWPRGLDKRFVGKWGLWFVIDTAAARAKEPDFTDSDWEKSGLLEDALYGTLELLADGAVFGNASKIPPQERSVTWHVEGNRLVFAEPLSSLPTWLRIRLIVPRMKMTGQYMVFGHSHVYEIATVETDRIRFTATPDGYHELRRTAVDLRPTVPTD